MAKADKEEVVIVCARITTPLYMPDNRVGKCSECGWKVQFRPHAKGRKICMECAAGLVEPDTKVKVPQRMLEDLKNFYAKKRQ
jgi:hypothetical protein